MIEFLAAVFFFGTFSTLYTMSIANYLSDGKWDYDRGKVRNAWIVSGIFWYVVYEWPFL